MQIPTFWRTFSQKIKSFESAKYHTYTFPFQAVLRAHSTGTSRQKRGGWQP